MGEVGEIGQHHGRVRTRLVLAAEFGKRCGRDITAHDMLEKVDDTGPVGKAQHGADGIGMNHAAAMRDRLVEQRETVTRRAFGGTRDHRQRLFLASMPSLDAIVENSPTRSPGTDPAQVEALAAGENGDRNLADFGRREDEFHMLRRLFERLQQPLKAAVDSMCTSSMI